MRSSRRLSFLLFAPPCFKRLLAARDRTCLSLFLNELPSMIWGLACVLSCFGSAIVDGCAKLNIPVHKVFL